MITYTDVFFCVLRTWPGFPNCDPIYFLWEHSKLHKCAVKLLKLNKSVQMLHTRTWQLCIILHVYINYAELYIAICIRALLRNTPHCATNIHHTSPVLLVSLLNRHKSTDLHCSHEGYLSGSLG